MQIRDTRGRKALVQMDLFLFHIFRAKLSLAKEQIGSMDLDEKEER